MDVTLPTELRRFVEEQVSSGRFSSADEVIGAGLARLMLDGEDDLDSADAQAIAESEGQIERGEDLDWKDVSTSLRSRFLGK